MKRFIATNPEPYDPWYSVTDTKTGRLMATFSQDMPAIKGFTRPSGEEFSHNIAELLNADAVESKEV